MGLKKAFRMPRMAAAKKAEKKPLTSIPVTMYEANSIAAVKMSHLTKSPLISFSTLMLVEVEKMCFAQVFHDFGSRRNNAKNKRGAIRHFIESQNP
jgi:hypothetical protein